MAQKISAPTYMDKKGKIHLHESSADYDDIYEELINELVALGFQRSTDAINILNFISSNTNDVIKYIELGKQMLKDVQSG